VFSFYKAVLFRITSPPKDSFSLSWISLPIKIDPCQYIGGTLLTLKQLWRMIENPVYAGVNPEKWTQDKPVKCRFEGLVSVDLFNRANRGKIIITEDEDGVRIHRRKPPEYLVKKGVKNIDFPYKRIVMCPECRKPLYGSASRGRHGKYFPAYHCDHRGHYFRRNKKAFDKTIEDFVKSLSISPNYIDALIAGVNEAFEKQQIDIHRDSLTIDQRIHELQKQVRVAVDKIKLVSSASTIKYLEEDIVKLEAEIEELNLQRRDTAPQKPTNMDKISAYVRYYLEHLEELLLHHCNPILQAKYFGLIFNQAPTFADIESGTPDISKITGVNEVFIAKNQYSETHGWG
jgi:site-specific DNA recombinase